MIGVNNKNLHSNLLIFKFKNYTMNYPDNIKPVIKFSQNTGEYQSLENLNTLNQCEYKNVFILGLGTTEEFNSVKFSKCLGYALLKLKCHIDTLDIFDSFSEDFGYTLGETIKLSLYKYMGIRNEAKKIKLQDINVISHFKNSINKGLTVGENINFARDLINMPSNRISPKYIVQQAENIAKEENLDIDIMDKYRLEQLGMNCIIDVGKGSINNPSLIVMQYFGNPNSKEIISLIGKGITFDSGGLCLKSKKGMQDMITDMAGAASILAVMKTVAKLKPDKNILALIPTAENLPSESCYKPGDVVVSYSGKTVEVTNTDAEGRLILCDAISYAIELGSTAIIDVATLTGSCANFLGNINIGLFSNSNELSSRLIDCGKSVGENIWRLPDNEEYLDELKTDAADIKNSGTSCGAIVAGMFLQSFCDDVDFAHLDIAGCAYNYKACPPYDKGANAIPAKTLIEFIMR